MITGHFGLAAAVKARRPECPLWVLMLATVWLDIIFVPLFLADIETIEKAPDATRPYGDGIIHATYTHSIPGVILLAGIFGYGCAHRWGKSVGWVAALVVASHWLLDVIVHRADLVLIPGVTALPALGLGLWRYPYAAAGLELAILLAGSALYWQAARDAQIKAGQSTTRANGLALSLLLSGLVVLAMDFNGIA
jgi:membrane-bound metal-dependent hydrolase YbcI (DUF457 family)